MADIRMMNEDLKIWFGLTKLPFQPVAKLSDLYMRSEMEEAASGARFAVESNYFYMIIGDVGSGKSTTLDYVASKLDGKRYYPVRVICGAWNFPELLRQVMHSLSIITRSGQQSRMLLEISHSYASIKETGKIPVLFLDEASMLNPEVYQQLHLLSNRAMTNSDAPPVSLILCGQESMIDKANSLSCRPLMSRVLSGCRLTGLSQQDSINYIDHQVRNIASGEPDDIFVPEAKIAVAQASAGIPRKINEICLNAMYKAMKDERHIISLECVVSVSRRNWWEDARA